MASFERKAGGGDGFLARLEGFDMAKEFFRRAVERGRLSHAYIFHGPAGAGKRRFALALSQAFFCREERSPCGDCIECRRVDSGNHPSVMVLSPGRRFIEIDDIRGIEGAAGLKDEGLMVFIIESADRMTPPAANCFLKTAEEPGGEDTAILMILLVENLGAVLPTIRSRCQRIPFHRPGPGMPDDMRIDPSILSAARGGDSHVLLRPGFEGRLREGVAELLLRLLEANRGASAAILARTADPGPLEDAKTLGWVPGTLDEVDRRAVELLTMAEDLERNVNPDLILDAVVGLLRARSPGRGDPGIGGGRKD